VKAVGYLRVSTEEQLAGTGLQGQQETIQALGHEIVKWCADEGISGSNGLDARDGLAEALHLLATGEVEAIIVYRLDRLARDMVLQEQLLREIWKYGQLISCSPAETEYCQPDPDNIDPSRQLIRQILGAVAAYERNMIRLRMKAGLRRHLTAGGRHGHRAPYGWRWDNKQLVEVHGQQNVIGSILTMAEGMSSREIADTLTREGVPGPKGGGWSHVTIAKIIKRAQEDT
jgi:DNA invertase Pin-like site-specific DNA recombinase